MVQPVFWLSTPSCPCIASSRYTDGHVESTFTFSSGNPGRSTSISYLHQTTVNVIGLPAAGTNTLGK